jgi:hypothetical protein
VIQVPAGTVFAKAAMRALNSPGVFASRSCTDASRDRRGSALRVDEAEMARVTAASGRADSCEVHATNVMSARKP